MERRQKIIDTWGDADASVLAEMLATLDKRIEAEVALQNSGDQRSASDPTYNAGNYKKTRMVSTADTMEDLKRHRDDTSRAASDPQHTIRLVSPEPASLPGFKMRPLLIRKNKAMPINSLRGGPVETTEHQGDREGFDPRIGGNKSLDTIEESPALTRERHIPVSPVFSRGWSWLSKRPNGLESQAAVGQKSLSEQVANAKGEIGQSHSTTSSEMTTRAVDLDTPEYRQLVDMKRKRFRWMFSKKHKSNTAVSSNDHEIAEDISEDAESNLDEGESRRRRNKGKEVARSYYAPVTSVDAATAAAAHSPIVINQNWFAKFFRVKPAHYVLCFQVSKVATRKALVKLLKDWHKYGLRDVVCQKQKSGDIIRARVDACNCE
jgi:hypothetical protein